MSRNATSEVDERAHAPLGTDEHDFWDRPTDVDERLVIAEEELHAGASRGRVRAKIMHRNAQ